MSFEQVLATNGMIQWDECQGGGRKAIGLKRLINSPLRATDKDRGRIDSRSFCRRRELRSADSHRARRFDPYSDLTPLHLHDRNADLVTDPNLVADLSG